MHFVYCAVFLISAFFHDTVDISVLRVMLYNFVVVVTARV